MTQVTNTRYDHSTSRIGLSKDDQSIVSKSCRSNRRSSIGSTAELKYRFRSKQFTTAVKPFSSCTVSGRDDDDDLSECSTILSSMELSTSSLFSQEQNDDSHDLPLPLEDEKETSGHVLKDSILHKYGMSPSPSPRGDKLNISDTMKQQLRFGGLDQAGPTFPESQDRRKMLSRWASEGHMTSVDDESENGEKRIRDKPPTSPVRKRRAVATVDVSFSAPSVETNGDTGDKKNSTSEDTNPTGTTTTSSFNQRGSTSEVGGNIITEKVTGKKVSVSSTATMFNRRASTGVLRGSDHPVVQLGQERKSFQAPVSTVKPDKAPTCPDRRKQFVRRHSTGSSASLESMIMCKMDEDEEGEDGVQRRRKRKSRRPSKLASISVGEISKDSKGIKKKSKQKSCKLKKEKSSKKIKDRGIERDEPSGSTDSSDCVSSSCKDIMSNDSLFSLLVQADPPRPSTQSSSETMKTLQSDETLGYQCSRVSFSRCASTGVIAGDGVIMRKTKFEGTTATAPVELKSSKKSIFALWSKLGVKRK